MEKISTSNFSIGKVILVCILALFVFVVVRGVVRRVTLARSRQTTSPSGQIGEVPVAYQNLYASVQKQLDSFQNKLDAMPKTNSTTPLAFGSDLSYANDNIGPYLLTSDGLDRVKKQLDGFQVVGITGVHVAMQWPILSQKYNPDYDKYMVFYKSVAQELKKRNIKMFVHNTIAMGKPYSSYDHPIPKISFDEYKKEKRQMVENIINNLHPEYLILTSEPGNEATNSGISELGNPDRSKELVSYVLNGDGATVGALDKGTTLVGAGSGTWDDIAFDKKYAIMPTLDFITLHVYPIRGSQMDSAIAMAKIASDNNKRFVIDEAWLYKLGEGEKTSGIATGPEIYKRDFFSFFQPQDQQFIQEMTLFAKNAHAEFLGMFWARNLFAYIDYQPGDEKLSYTQLQQAENKASNKNLTNITLSSTGTFYKRLILGN